MNLWQYNIQEAMANVLFVQAKRCEVVWPQITNMYVYRTNAFAGLWLQTHLSPVTNVFVTGDECIRHWRQTWLSSEGKRKYVILSLTGTA